MKAIFIWILFLAIATQLLSVKVTDNELALKMAKEEVWIHREIT